jgi:hypothetical protein
MKTKIIILTSAVFLFCSIEQHARTFTTGLSVGASTTSVNFSNLNNAFANTIKGKNIIGVEGGIFERISFGKVFIKPMLLVSYHTGTINFYDNNGTVSSSDFDYGKAVVPVLFGIRILKFFRIEAGPVYDWVYNSNYSHDNVIKMESSGFGYRAGANIEIKRINFGFTYQVLTNKSFFNNDLATFSSPNELIFSVAYCFRERG